eukprot:7496884-Heterocapsa_arctica.AAC.1
MALTRLLIHPKGRVTRGESARNVQEEGLNFVRMQHDIVSALGRAATRVRGRRGFSSAIRMVVAARLHGGS